MYKGIGLQNTLRELKILFFITHKNLICITEINFVLSVDPQRMSSRVRLTQEVGPVSTGRINGTLTLIKDQQMCVNTTAILEVIIIIMSLISTKNSDFVDENKPLTLRTYLMQIVHLLYLQFIF